MIGQDSYWMEGVHVMGFDYDEYRKMVGISEEETQEGIAEAQEAIAMLTKLMGMWFVILGALDEGNTAVASLMSICASRFIADLDENTLRWMVSAATKAIASKIRSEAQLGNVDPVAAAEQILREATSG